MTNNSNRSRQGRRRGDRGQGVVVLMFFLAAFVVGPVSFFAYEVSLYNLAKFELKASIDAAALGAGCQQASSNTTDFTTTQNNAEATALWVFQQNSILGNSLSTATTSTSLPMAPPNNQAQLYFKFINPDTGGYVSSGDALGKTIQVMGSYTFVPAFANFVNLKAVTAPINDFSNGGLPMLDVILCFDLSSSMDDFTDVWLVSRFNSGGNNGYTSKNKGGSGVNSNGSQPMYLAMGCSNTTGTGTNNTWPLLMGTDGTVSISSSYHGSNQHVKPSSYSSSLNSASTVTDITVDVSSTECSAKGAPTTSSNGKSFGTVATSNVGFLVEASRGNLETSAAATSAGVTAAMLSSWGSTSGIGTIVPGTGWFAAYWELANDPHLCVPIGAGLLASQNFFTIMNNDTDAHFGLVTYADNEGSSATSTTGSGVNAYGGSNCTTLPADDVYASGTPLPLIPLTPGATAAATNYTTCLQIMQNKFNASNASQSTMENNQLKANGSTDIGGALFHAMDLIMLSTDHNADGYSPSNKARIGATRAIVLFTDGLPTVQTSSIAPAQIATDAKGIGVPIYCIGLCMTPTLQASQNAALNTIVNNSGNGAQYFQATSVQSLDNAFEAVARSLVQLVR